MFVAVGVRVRNIAMLVRVFMVVRMGMSMFMRMGLLRSYLLAFPQNITCQYSQPEGDKSTDNAGETSAQLALPRLFSDIFGILCFGCHFRFPEVVVRQECQFLLNPEESFMDKVF